MADSIKKKAINGMAWTILEKVMVQGVQFVISIIIARILMPSDYGIVGMLAIFMAIASTFVDSGFGSALIQRKNRNEVDYSTIFIFNILLSILIYLLFFFSAPLIADFYDVPLLKPVTRIVALSLIVNGLTIVQSAKLTIDLDFKRRALITVISTLISGIIGIVMAYSGCGVWALVYQGLASAVINSFLLWVTSNWRPTMVFSMESFKTLGSFGSKLLGSSLINTIYNNLYTMVIGKAFNPSDVGFYNRASSLSSLPSNIAMSAIIGVNYPILSQLQDDDEQLINAYKKLLRVPMFVLYPVLIGLACIAEPLITILLGEKWLPCVPYIQVLSIGAMFWPLTHINLNLLYVKGRSDLVLKLELIKKPIGFAILFASIPLGIMGMCVGKVLYDFIAFSFNCHYTKKLLNYGEIAQLKELLPIIFNCTIMAALVIASMTFCQAAFWQLVVGVIVGLISYYGIAVLFKDSSLIELQDILMQRLINGKKQ